jgi:branched-chain amino acid transport system substrate-binding protein
VLADVTGVFAIEATEIRLNTDLAVAQINASGGINGHPIQVVYSDPRADPAEAVTQATQLVQQDHVDVLIGGVSSAECLGVQQLAPKLGVVYLSSSGCGSEDLTAKTCNRYSFRITSVGRQQYFPLAKYMVDTYGKRWGIIYPDYAFGQSQAQAYDAALANSGGTLPIKIAVPLNEQNMATYVTKIPTDGSINGLIVSQAGTDLGRILTAIQQFGINKKLPLVGSEQKELFGGVYPDLLDGAIAVTAHPSSPPSDNKFDQDYTAAFKDLASKNPDQARVLGGAGNAVPGFNGYTAYITITALKEAMIASKFSGKGDTDKLIAALENLKSSKGTDFPAGDFVMNKADHQGRDTQYVVKVNGQKEDILSAVPPDQLPAIGSCQAS